MQYQKKGKKLFYFKKNLCKTKQYNKANFFIPLIPFYFYECFAIFWLNWQNVELL